MRGVALWILGLVLALWVVNVLPTALKLPWCLVVAGVLTWWDRGRCEHR